MRPHLEEITKGICHDEHHTHPLHAKGRSDHQNSPLSACIRCFSAGQSYDWDMFTCGTPSTRASAIPHGHRGNTSEEMLHRHSPYLLSRSAWSKLTSGISPYNPIRVQRSTFNVRTYLALQVWCDYEQASLLFTIPKSTVANNNLLVLVCT